ncbi:unnamed protein product [Effrenium voratum]|nr:unnamed protein product [Effrenium voratum]
MPACAGDAKSSYPGTSAGDQEEQDQIWRKPATADRPDFLKPSLMTAGGEPVVVPDMKSNPRLLRVDDPEDQIWRKPAALADRPDLLKPSLMTAGGAPVVVPDADEMKGNLGFLHDWHAEGLNPNDSPKPNLLTAGGAPVATDAETRDPRVRAVASPMCSHDRANIAVKSHARAVATPMRRRDAADDPASELGRVRAVATPLRRRDTADDPVADSSPMLPSMLRPAPQAAPLVPIAQLSSFMPRCRVRARVLSKSGIRAFTNARGSSKLFSMDLMDAEGACTRCTCFGSAVDKFFPMIVVKKIYEVNGASVKPGNPRFCRYPMELTLDERGASITALLEDGSIPGIPYKFVSLAQISSAPVGSSCDIMGVVQTLEDPVSVATRSGPRIKRQVILIDSSSASVARIPADGLVYGCGSVSNGIAEGWGSKAAVPGTDFSQEEYRAAISSAATVARFLAPMIARTMLDFGGRNVYACMLLAMVALACATVHSATTMVWNLQREKAETLSA